MKIGMFATLVLILIVPAHPASAQINPADAVYAFGILADPGVQADLKLDPEQIAQANAVATEARRSYQAMFQSLRGLSVEERMKQAPAMAQTLRDQGMAVLKASFKPEQIQRYEQILLQQNSPGSLLEPAMSKALVLTEDQADKIRGIIQDTNVPRRQIIQENYMKTGVPGGKRPASDTGERLAALTRESQEKALALLTPEQKARWGKLVGPPFQPKPRLNPTPAPAPSRPE